MDNPWSALPQRPPFALSGDFKAIDDHNVRFGRRDPTAKVRLDLIPEPFLGHPEAPVVALALQPSVSPRDAHYHQHNAVFIEKCRNNLTHSNSDYPLYLLDTEPNISSSPGASWWHQKLDALIADCGKDGAAKVARNLFVVQLFGYRCEKWQPKFPQLPSQHYAFDLVERAMGRGAVIVTLYKGRHNGGWLERMPELLDYPRLHMLSSMQSAYITRRNCPGGYDEIVAAICGKGA